MKSVSHVSVTQITSKFVERTKDWNWGNLLTRLLALKKQTVIDSVDKSRGKSLDAL